MTRTFFSAAQQHALDSYDVPPMRSDFAERVVQRAMAVPSAAIAADIAPLRPSRNRSPWTRAGRRIGAFATLTILSGAAAAMGLFGNPERIPVVGPIVGEVMAQVFPDKPAPIVAANRIPVERDLSDASAGLKESTILPRVLSPDTHQAEISAGERSTNIARPATRQATPQTERERPSLTRAAQLRRAQPDLPPRMPAAANPDAAQIRERLTEAGVSDPAALRERIAERLETRVEPQADSPSGQTDTRRAAVADALQQQIDKPAQLDQAQLRARAAERARQQMREQRQVKPPRARPRDVPRERRTLRRRRR